MPDNRILDGIKTMSEGSNTILGWVLAIIGGSILIIVSTSYIRPVDKKIRLIYLLFIPGWSFLTISLYYGDKINRRKIAAALVGDEGILKNIGYEINKEFSSQLLYFNIGISIFIVWLIIYLIWWIFGNWQLKPS
jgi:hypothetical protein